ncbi:GNAT family N-acetyltransferase [Caulobacter segnis]|uniref:GNAT family N-acetyltransferase n=1 Tax=Caulobacter segnis TaxID=88688 RepID=UPI00240EA44E|nr:GNAT family N-acetyltransferase [Caulobacter segnis]MDG2520836.1 GNAT family N-acetyltransferase [Caulobacter segnis]
MNVIGRTPIIETRRLALREPLSADAQRLTELIDYDIAKMTTRMPWPYSPEDADAFVVQVQMQDRRRDNTFAITLEGEGLIGVLGFFLTPEGRTEVGYWIGRPYWGRGLASEALMGALSWASRDWRKRLVVAGHFADNPASGRVLCKAGFLYTGIVDAKPSRARGEPADTRMMVWLA